LIVLPVCWYAMVWLTRMRDRRWFPVKDTEVTATVDSASVANGECVDSSRV
jgi:hypothetical protein